MALCFYCFLVNSWKDIRAIAVTREKSGLAPLNAIPISQPTPRSNIAMETSPLIAVDVILVSTMPVIVLDRFTFLQTFRKLRFSQ